MKWTGGIACMIVGMDCAHQALGTSPQVIFSQSALWVWWIVAALWFIAALRFFLTPTIT